jgi:L-aspartate oxidase
LRTVIAFAAVSAEEDLPLAATPALADARHGRLERAQHRIRLLTEEINEYYQNFRVSNDLIELRNLVLTADLIVQCAMLRHESRGLHYSRDYPELLPAAKNTVLVPGGR